MSDTPTLDTLIETLEGIHEHAPGLADRGVWLGENRTTILAAALEALRAKMEASK